MKKINLNHFDHLVDDFGIWQHTQGTIIDRRYGYALDDAARGLILAHNLNDQKKVGIFRKFIEDSAQFDFTTFFDANREAVIKRSSSEDAIGETYWALCKIGSTDVLLLQKLKSRIRQFKYLRGKCYALIGASMEDQGLAGDLFADLVAMYDKNMRSNWGWIEPSLSYGNAIVPLAFLSYYRHSADATAGTLGFSLLNFLNRIAKWRSIPIAIGNQAWFIRGSKKSLFDQQPIDIAYQILANTLAFELSGNDKFAKEAIKYYNWFWGHNLLSQPLIDELSNRCCDGLTANGTSPNSGAESIICYHLAQREIEKIAAIKASERFLFQ